MSLKNVSAGKDVPNDVNVIIEIPALSEPVKYEVDKDTGALFVDRFIGTAMHYPCNYGYIPQTLSDDGDPADVLVITPIPLRAGSVVRCRFIGVLDMTDESGRDEKLLAVPVAKMTSEYNSINEASDLPPSVLDKIKHFFEHYKDLEAGKWVKVEGWGDSAKAREVIEKAVADYK